MVRFGKATIFSLCFFVIFNSTACFLLIPNVHYVLPNNYIGMFKIILDESNGVYVEKKNWRFVYEIPPDGILRVKSFEPFRNAHEVTASFKDGTEITTVTSNVSDDTVALRNGSEYEAGNNPPTYFMVIGTKKQLAFIFEKHMSDSDFDKNSPEFYNNQVKLMK